MFTNLGQRQLHRRLGQRRAHCLVRGRGLQTCEVCHYLEGELRLAQMDVNLPTGGNRDRHV